jgi:RimJ/RimL family protein N-acetyltransferase
MKSESQSQSDIGCGDLSYREIDPVRDHAAVVDFLVGGTWPFHGKSRPTAEQAARVKLGPPEEARAFWVVEHDERIGFIRLFDLEDADDGSVQFDLRIAVLHRGRGIGRQAVAWLTRYLFETYPQLHRIEASTRADNDAMRRVLGQNGYRLEGLLRETWRSDDGTRYDTALYGRLRHEA